LRSSLGAGPCVGASISQNKLIYRNPMLCCAHKKSTI
jgi:hypothetical protein